MFLWDWAFTEVIDAMVDWTYSVMVSVIGVMLANTGMMGAELLELPFVQAVVMFFRLLAWTLYVIGLVVAVFEAGIEYQCGRACLKDTALAAIKGFMAVGLFTVVPVRLFRLTFQLQVLLISAVTGIPAAASGDAWATAWQPFIASETPGQFAGQLGDLGGNLNSAHILLVVIMIAYAFIKVFFASFKRGGILLIQISVGSLYMFSVARGYNDAFYNWCKQVLALCLTSFMQVLMLTVGLLVLKPHMILGLGLMLAATEVPRIAGTFGLDTSMRVNVMGAVHGAQMAVGAAKKIGEVVGG